MKLDTHNSINSEFMFVIAFSVISCSTVLNISQLPFHFTITTVEISVKSLLILPPSNLYLLLCF